MGVRGLKYQTYYIIITMLHTRRTLILPYLLYIPASKSLPPSAFTPLHISHTYLIRQLYFVEMAGFVETSVEASERLVSHTHTNDSGDLFIVTRYT